MFWHGTFGLSFAILAIAIEYFAKDSGSGDGLHLFNMGWQVFGLMLAATAFDTVAVNFGTIGF